MLGIAIGATVAAGSAVGVYQSIAPTAQWYGRAFCGAPGESKQIALTFDDGPNDPHTLHLLDLLARNNVRATFFMIGRYVRQRPDLALEVSKQGHVVGNHTFTHPFLSVHSLQRVRNEILECNKALKDVLGEHSNLFRPPWGARRPGLFSVARQLGLEPVMWNVTGFDWNAPSADYIENKVVPRIRGGNVVLLHDGGHAAFGIDRSKTVQAVGRLVSRYATEGYKFVTIPEMMDSCNKSAGASNGARLPKT